MDTIGRYQLVEKLGQGGMGVVYRAFDPILQRVVAVKLIGAIEANSDLKERFFREARAAGQLSHRNIITIHDLGEHEGQPFLAMELLEGQDLHQRLIARMPMTLARKVELAIQICDGIEYAHLNGVIHRDIKPANIFITAHGTAKLLDFGLARLITSELTNSNMMMGTLNYMAPEQVRGERADHRSDIFSTGVVLYELLGGRKAFEGDSFAATLYKILQTTPEPLQNLDASIPPELIAIVDRALEKTREARYQHMSEMLADLGAYRQQLMLLDSGAFARPGSDLTRIGSDASRRSAIRSEPFVPAWTASDAAARAANATTIHVPSGAHLPPATPSQGSLPAPGTGAGSAVGLGPYRQPALAAAAAVIVLLIGFAAWMIQRDDPPPPASAAAPGGASGGAAEQAIANRLEQASRLQLAGQALQVGDHAGARRYAEEVLAVAPDHVEAGQLRDRAQQLSETVSRGLTDARSHLAAGRYDEASRSAGEVLAVDPANAEARGLMDEGATRTAGKGTDEARNRAARARNAATAAAAPALAAAAYGAALSAEREAARLSRTGRQAEAMGKFWEATGLFRSAEIAAQTEAAARTARAQAAPPARPAAEPKPAPPPPTTPVLPAPASSGLSLPPSSPTGPPPAAPAAAPSAAAPSAATPSAATPPPPAEPAAPAVPPSAAIREVLDRYRAALEGRSIEALKRLWPNLGGAQESAIRLDFRNASRIDVEILDPQITVSGANATATFIRRYQVQTQDRQRLETDTRTTMSLRWSGTVWSIDGMRFETVK